MSDAHIAATAEIILDLCTLDTKKDLIAVERAAEGAGKVIAGAVASAEAACVSEGAGAFGCAHAVASAEAWAFATASAHADAVARAQGDCACIARAGTLSVGESAEFAGLIAEAFARAEVTACVEGDDTAQAFAFSACVGEAYARLMVKVCRK